MRGGLAFDFDVARLDDGDYFIDDSEEAARKLNRLGFAPSLSEFHGLADRWRGLMVEGLEEYGKRMATDLRE